MGKNEDKRIEKGTTGVYVHTCVRASLERCRRHPCMLRRGMLGCIRRLDNVSLHACGAFLFPPHRSSQGLGVWIPDQQLLPNLTTETAASC